MRSYNESAPCAVCGTPLVPALSIQLRTVGHTVIYIKNIPCEKCSKCGQEYFDIKTDDKVNATTVGVDGSQDEVKLIVIDYNDINN